MPQEPINEGELDALAVLWAEAASSTPRPALKLSEIHELIAKRRTKRREPQPALSTVSAYLRSLVAKKLVREVVIEDSPSEPGAGVTMRGVGKNRPLRRSPKTGYQIDKKPRDVLHKMFEMLIAAYPESERHQSLLDFAHAMKLDGEKIKKLEKLLED